MDSDHWLIFLKYGGTLVAAIYGLYATVTDFHEERNGKKVLSRRGYFGIALLLIASSSNGISEYYKDQHDAAASKAELSDRKTLLAGEQLSNTQMVKSLNKLAGLTTTMNGNNINPEYQTCQIPKKRCYLF